MYIPKHYIGEGKKRAMAFMETFNFGLMVTSEGERPISTHLPFLISERGDNLILTSHFAKANPQLNHLEQKQTLVVFSEPHAYISPKHYERNENVPTWNYVAVHAYGNVTLFDKEGSIRVLEESMKTFDPDYLNQWKTVSDEYKERLLRGMIAFEIEVTELQFKEKLSQNKSAHERQNMIEAFSKGDDDAAKKLGNIMANKPYK